MEPIGLALTSVWHSPEIKGEERILKLILTNFGHQRDRTRDFLLWIVNMFKIASWVTLLGGNAIRQLARRAVPVGEVASGGEIW